jgi:hypothetical protein
MVMGLGELVAGRLDEGAHQVSAICFFKDIEPVAVRCGDELDTTAGQAGLGDNHPGALNVAVEVG